MNYPIKSNRTQAIKTAKQSLRNIFNVSRLPYTDVQRSRCNCGCGETSAITVVAIVNDKVESVVVGICKHCA